MTEQQSIELGVIVMIISILVGVVLGSISMWMMVNALTFGGVFLIYMICMRNELGLCTGCGIFLGFLISFGVTAFSTLVMSTYAESEVITIVEYDAIHRNEELGNRITINHEDNIFTTTDGAIWILDDSDIILESLQSYNIYGFKTVPKYIRIGKRPAVIAEATEVEEL